LPAFFLNQPTTKPFAPVFYQAVQAEVLMKKSAGLEALPRTTLEIFHNQPKGKGLLETAAGIGRNDTSEI